MVKPVNMEKHFRKTHEESNRVTTGGPRPPDDYSSWTAYARDLDRRGQNEWAKCPFCDYAAAPFSLRRHLNNKHGIKPALLQVPQRHTDWIPQGAGFYRRLEDESYRDASYGWGQLYRDNGQFGSHPTFDGYDDESKP